PNISVLEQNGSSAPTPTAVQVLAPTPVFRLARSVFTQPGRPHFTFFLPSAPTVPIDMEILDSSGKTIRKQQVTAHQGWNGADWDLRYEAPTLVALKTTP